MNNGADCWWLQDGINSIFSVINQGIYFLLSGVYAILINIADSEILSSATVSSFYSRIQLIIGVFMIFRLTFTALQGIVNPDQLTDSKSGAGNLITKIVVSLALLTMLVPINIPLPENQMNSFEKNISSSGLLFGTLYDFQHRILSQNILAKLVLGTNTASSSDSSLTDIGNDLSSIVLKSFFTPNLKEGVDNTFELEIDSNGVSRYKEEYLYCDMTDSDSDSVEAAYNTYYNTNDTTKILNMVNQPCEIDPNSNPDINGWDKYAFNFNWFPALIVGIIFLVVLVMLCIEVAKRAIKLAILRLIAPIPIISYMDTKASMDKGTLGAWVKTLGSTYIDLFVYLLVTFFVIFVIGEIDRNGLSFGSDVSGIVVIFSKIFIYIGLLLFAQEAPKFCKQALGIKDNGGNGLFSGLGKVAGLGAAAAGAVGSARTNYRAAKEENDELHKGSKLNGLRNAGSALLGGMAGMATGTKAAITAKDHSTSAAMKAMQQRNNRRMGGATLLGGAATGMETLLRGQPYHSMIDQENERRDQRINSGRELQEFLNSKGKGYGGVNVTASYKDNTGNSRTITGSLDDYKAALEQQREKARTSGNAADQILSFGGQNINVFSDEAENVIKGMTTQSGIAWANANATDEEYLSLRDAYESNGGTEFEDSYAIKQDVERVTQEKRNATTERRYRRSKNNYNSQ